MDNISWLTIFLKKFFYWFKFNLVNKNSLEILNFRKMQKNAKKCKIFEFNWVYEKKLSYILINLKFFKFNWIINLIFFNCFCIFIFYLYIHNFQQWSAWIKDYFDRIKNVQPRTFIRCQ